MSKSSNGTHGSGSSASISVTTVIPAALARQQARTDPRAKRNRHLSHLDVQSDQRGAQDRAGQPPLRRPNLVEGNGR